MALMLLISFLLCFSGGLLLSVVLLSKDATQLWKNRNEYFWGTTVALLFSISQVGLPIAGTVAIVIAFTVDTEPHWLDAVILCTLQLCVGANVRIMLLAEMDCQELMICVACPDALRPQQSPLVHMDNIW
jgi:hypothetical protein